jgi:hypothetical protein
MNSDGQHVLVQGIKFFAPIRRLLRRLHKARAHHNRKLHYDEYTSLLLLAFFQPASQTLRWVQHASGLKRVQTKLGVSRASLGSLSDASRVFDPELLRQIFLQLASEAGAANALPRPRGLPADLRVIAADGTLWETLPKMARALFEKPLTRRKKGVFKGHFQFDIFQHVPCSADFSMSDNGEAAELERRLRSNALYVLDRGFVHYGLYSKIMAAGSSFLARIKEVCAVEVIEQRPLDAAAAAAGIQCDALIRLGSGVDRMERPLRLIRAKITLPPPHNLHPVRSRGKYKAYEPGTAREQELLLLTDRLELDAQTLVMLYRYRWQVELFFRWFKCVLGSKHLMAQTENGLNLQMYAALIASLLVVIWTARRPTQRLLNALNFYLIGWSSWDELQVEIERAPASKP